MLDDSVQILLPDAEALERAGTQRQPGQPMIVVHAQRRQNLGEQPHAASRRGRVDAHVHVFRIHAHREEVRGHGMRAGRRVAEAKAAGVGNDRDVQCLRDGRRDIQTERRRQVVDQLPGRTRGHVGEHDVAGRILRCDVVVNHELRHSERAHRRREIAESFDVTDVEHNEQVDIAERGCAARRFVAHVLGQ